MQSSISRLQTPRPLPASQTRFFNGDAQIARCGSGTEHPVPASRTYELAKGEHLVPRGLDGVLLMRYA